MSSPRVILITGAGGGIGSALARRLATPDTALVLLGRNSEKLAAVAALAAQQGAQTLTLAGDLTDDAYAADCVRTAAAHFGGLDVLVNNAGMTLSSPLEQTPIAQYDRIMAINARAPYLMCQLALPLLRKSACASILNIASVVAHKGYPLQSAYAASKHALAGFTKSLANEVYRDGIRVHMIAPGGVFTDMVRISRPDLTGEDMILPEDIAEIAAFLLEHRTNAVIDEICVHRAGKEPFA